MTDRGHPSRADASRKRAAPLGVRGQGDPHGIVLAGRTSRVPACARACGGQRRLSAPLQQPGAPQDPPLAVPPGSSVSWTEQRAPPGSSCPRADRSNNPLQKCGRLIADLNQGGINVVRRYPPGGKNTGKFAASHGMAGGLVWKQWGLSRRTSPAFAIPLLYTGDFADQKQSPPSILGAPYDHRYGPTVES